MIELLAVDRDEAFLADIKKVHGLCYEIAQSVAPWCLSYIKCPDVNRKGG